MHCRTAVQGTERVLPVLVRIAFALPSWRFLSLLPPNAACACTLCLYLVRSLVRLPSFARDFAHLRAHSPLVLVLQTRNNLYLRTDLIIIINSCLVDVLPPAQLVSRNARVRDNSAVNNKLLFTLRAVSSAFPFPVFLVHGLPFRAFAFRFVALIFFSSRSVLRPTKEGFSTPRCILLTRSKRERELHTVQ